MRVISAESTELFVGPPHAPLQIVRVSYTGASAPALVRIGGEGVARGRRGMVRVAGAGRLVRSPAVTVRLR